MTTTSQDNNINDIEFLKPHFIGFAVINMLVLFLQPYYIPSYIYSCSINHILEHEFCHLSCCAVREKIPKLRNFCLSMLLLGMVFFMFSWAKMIFSIFVEYFFYRQKQLPFTIFWSEIVSVIQRRALKTNCIQNWVSERCF